MTAFNSCFVPDGPIIVTRTGSLSWSVSSEIERKGQHSLSRTTHSEIIEKAWALFGNSIRYPSSSSSVLLCSLSMKLVSSVCRLLCVSLKADRSHDTDCITLNSPLGIKSESPRYELLSIQRFKRGVSTR